MRKRMNVVDESGRTLSPALAWILTTLLLAGLAFSGQSSVELGMLLFHDPAMGGSRNEKSCNSCHPEGRGLEQATLKQNVTEVIKSCILGPMDGNRVPDGWTCGP